MSVAASASLTLELPGGVVRALVKGTSLAVIGTGATAAVSRWADDLGAAVLLPDRRQPLHPGFSVADQVAAALGGTRRAAFDRATDLLELAGMPEPHHRVRARPHQLSALDRQRAQLALVLANEPELIVAEDPVAGLIPSEAAAFSAELARVWSRLGFTLVLACAELGPARRVPREVLVIDADGTVAERRVKHRAD